MQMGTGFRLVVYTFQARTKSNYIFSTYFIINSNTINNKCKIKFKKYEFCYRKVDKRQQDKAFDW